MRSASSSSPRACRMSAILPMVTARERTSPSSLEDRQLFLPADAQRLVELAAGLQDVGDLAHGHRPRRDVAEPLVDRQLLLLADAQRLVVLAAGLQDVGDLAHGDRPRPDVAEPLVDRQLLLPADAQGLVQLARGPAGCRRSCPWSPPRDARRRAARRPAAPPRGGCAGPRPVRPRACRMSAILPMVTARSSGRRRGARRPAAPPRGGCAGPRRGRRGPAGCRRSCPW